MLRTLAFGLAVSVGALLLIAVMALLIAAIGGVVGAGVGVGYNVAFGTTFDPRFTALIGSIVALAGGGTSAASKSQ